MGIFPIAFLNDNFSQGLFRLPNYLILQFCTTGSNGMYRDCIAPAIYSDSWSTMDTASEPGVRGTSFRAIPQSIKIINPFDFESKLTMIIFYFYLIDCGITLKEVPLMSIVACELEYTAKSMQSLYIPLLPVVQNCQIG